MCSVSYVTSKKPYNLFNHLEDLADTSLFQAFRLYGAKRGEEENQRGAGSGSESEGTPRVQQILVKPMNGLF